MFVIGFFDLHMMKLIHS